MSIDKCRAVSLSPSAPRTRAAVPFVAAGDDGAAGLVVAGQLLGRDLLAVAGVAGAVAVEVIRQDVALGAS